MNTTEDRWILAILPEPKKDARVSSARAKKIKKKEKTNLPRGASDWDLAEG